MQNFKVSKILLLVFFIFWASFSKASEELSFGFLPYFSPSKLISLHSPIIKYLEMETGMTISMISAPNFKEFQNRTKEGHYDLVYTAPHMARLAEIESNYQRVYMSTHRGRPIFLTKINSKINSLKDLKNMKIALPPPRAINHHVALKALSEYGLIDGKTVHVIVTPSHSSALLSLINGQVSIAVMGNAPWKSYKKDYQDQVRVLATSADFPGFIVMANPRISKKLVEMVKTAVIGFPKTVDGMEYLRRTGLKGLAAIDDKTMTELDPYVKAIFGVNPK